MTGCVHGEQGRAFADDELRGGGHSYPFGLWCRCTALVSSDDDAVTFRHRHARFGIEPARISLLSARPGNECRWHICSRGVREGIAAAEARINLQYGEHPVPIEDIAIEVADMP